MTLAVTPDARAFRRAVGVTAWCVLEELALTAAVDEHGALVACTNVRVLAEQLGVSKDTAARALNRLARVGVVGRVVGVRGARGALPKSSYRLDLASVSGLTLAISPPVTTAPAQPASRTRARPAPRVNDAQSSLFDLPSNAS